MPTLRCTGCNANFPPEPTPNEVAELGFPDDHGDLCPICEEWTVEGITNGSEHEHANLRERVTFHRFVRFLDEETPQAREERQARYRPILERTLARFEEAA